MRRVSSVQAVFIGDYMKRHPFFCRCFLLSLPLFFFLPNLYWLTDNVTVNKIKKQFTSMVGCINWKKFDIFLRIMFDTLTNPTTQSIIICVISRYFSIVKENTLRKLWKCYSVSTNRTKRVSNFIVQNGRLIDNISISSRYVFNSSFDIITQ